MIGYVTMGMALVPMVGPMIGGALDQMFGWHATFWLLSLTGAAVWLCATLIRAKLWPKAACRFATNCAATPSCFASPRFWGYALVRAFASGAFFALSGRRAVCCGTVFRALAVHVGCRSWRACHRLCAGQLPCGRYSVRFGINKWRCMAR